VDPRDSFRVLANLCNREFGSFDLETCGSRCNAERFTSMESAESLRSFASFWLGCFYLNECSAPLT
jgi:hypothetical protein